jgi:hypothetical protein
MLDKSQLALLALINPNNLFPSGLWDYGNESLNGFGYNNPSYNQFCLDQNFII